MNNNDLDKPATKRDLRDLERNLKQFIIERKNVDATSTPNSVAK
jgi:hypothetical protein